MRALLGLLMALMVSGETNITAENKNIRLPCNCSDRDPNKDFKWQMKSMTHDWELLFLENKTGKYYGENYKGRMNVSSDSCLHLENTTAKDEGQYKCICSKKTIYHYEVVNLIVSSASAKLEMKLPLETPAKDHFRKMVKIIPVVLMLGICLLLFYRWHNSYPHSE